VSYPASALLPLVGVALTAVRIGKALFSVCAVYFTFSSTGSIFAIAVLTFSKADCTVSEVVMFSPDIAAFIVILVLFNEFNLVTILSKATLTVFAAVGSPVSF
jgi:hypothetical protein